MKPKKAKTTDDRFRKMLVERVRQLRSEHRFTQEYVIENTHLDISRYEMGDSVPTLHSILKLCKFYQITLDEFFAPLNYPPKV